jgi:hypothetical protein
MDLRRGIALLAAAGLCLGAALAAVAASDSDGAVANLAAAGWEDVGSPDEPVENLSTPAAEPADPAVPASKSTGRPATAGDSADPAADALGVENLATPAQPAPPGSGPGAAAPAVISDDGDETENAVAIFEVYTPYCVVPGRKFCRYRQAGVEGYPCRCGSAAGRFTTPD